MTAGVVNLTGHIHDIQVDNTLGVYFPSGATLAKCHGTAQAMYNLWTGTISGALSTDYVLDGVNVTVPEDPTLTGAVVGSSGGGQSYQLLPLTVCAKVGWTTGLRGRSYRGRTGLAGLGESDTDTASPNSLTPGARTRISTQVQAFFDNINTVIASEGGGSVLAVVSLFHGVDPVTHRPIPRAVPLATPVTGWLVYSQLGTRRSRLT